MKNLNEEYIEKLTQQCLEEINNATSLQQLESIRVKYIGRKGELRKFFEELHNLDLEKKRQIGSLLNTSIRHIEEELKSKITKFKSSLTDSFKGEFANLEITLPGVKFSLGCLHPLNKIYKEIIQIFLNLGFNIEEGPEVEKEEYNFTLLNIPADHPARDMQDTLYLLDEFEEKLLLRTHTSPVQIRVMLSKKPPIKSIMPGRVYRHENLDASHLFNFHQVEGLMVDKGVKLSDLKGVLTFFAKKIFGENIQSRFRQSYFPFTEPSLEMDIQCLVCRGEGCSVCKNSGFVEILGCGMVHPKVLENVGIDYTKYTGFAFGLGVERIAMLKYKIDDIRLFYENDLRFIRQF
ncbi:MAG: phenylalanine--tRNA ligase subunit alpha [Endomicrobiia bacterium]